jgi:hypothetical protein
MFMFPSSRSDIGEHMVGVRDTNSFSFYDFGLPILAVRYLTVAQNATYSQTGTTLSITCSDHGYATGDNIYIKIIAGASSSETLSITVTSQNTFTATASASLTTSGTAKIQKVTTFSDPKWTEQRVQIRFIPTPVSLFAGERLADRILERDLGISSTYTRGAGTTVTVTTSSAHGLSTGNQVYLNVTSGNGQTGLFDVTVLSTTQFTVENIATGATSGNVTVQRRLRGYDYQDYVGYTVTGTDEDTDEILFQREESYGAKTTDGISRTVVPAHRGFTVGRYLTTEIRYQCTCADFMRREKFDLYSEARRRRFPSTPLTSLNEGTREDREGNTVDTVDDPGIFSGMKFVNINNFYQPPEYKDTAEFSYNNLKYYQIRWCKHIYAAMFSIVHDEGNDILNIASSYEQTGGPNITVTAPNHGLIANRRIELEVTSGNVTSGDFIVSQVVDENRFTVVAPVSLTTSGYCAVKNLKNHEYVNTWLFEPNDQPVGEALQKFYERFHKEFDKTREQADRMKMMGFGMPWTGTLTTTKDRDQPVQVGNFTPQLLTMLATDNIRRDKDAALDRTGTAQNQTATRLFMMQKLLNIPVNLLNDAKFDMLDQPLTEYTADFQFAQIDCDLYRNGAPVRETAEKLDCGTYTNGGRTVAVFATIDSGTYIN